MIQKYIFCVIANDDVSDVSVSLPEMFLLLLWQVDDTGEKKVAAVEEVTAVHLCTSNDEKNKKIKKRKTRKTKLFMLLLIKIKIEMTSCEK